MSSKKPIINVLRIAVLSFLLTLLTACASVTWKCEVGGTVNQQQQVIGAFSGGMIDASVSGSLSASSAPAAIAGALGVNSTLDASSITMDTSGSSVTWPQTGTVALTIRSKSNGAVLSAQSFPWTRNVSVITFSNPSAVNSWLSSSGADAATHKVDYDFQNLTMPAQQGSNLIAVDIYQDNVPQATAAATIPYEPCIPTPVYECEPW